MENLSVVCIQGRLDEGCFDKERSPLPVSLEEEVKGLKSLLIQLDLHL